MGYGKIGYDRIEWDRRGQRRGQNRTTRQNRKGQKRTGQDRTGQDRTGQDRTAQHRTRQERQDRFSSSFASLYTAGSSNKAAQENCILKRTHTLSSNVGMRFLAAELKQTNCVGTSSLRVESFGGERARARQKGIEGPG